MEDLKTYDTVMIPLSNGQEQEFAIMDEFTFENKHYIAVSVVLNDEIQEGLYIYRATPVGEQLDISRIEDVEEFEKVTAYYENH